ncbi:hypothetical protein [Halorientalis salina]|uniref:hypothetical protein n=1 Tax=Halorientalis salina TaxID=2932266 RepID=UPI0010AD815A|nr:hypothetical protein [Halorientalis salina]
MVSRETRVYLTGLALSVCLLIVAGFVLEVGLRTTQGAVVSVLFFPILPFLLPQLYLAATGDETENVPPGTRIRVSLLFSGLWILWLYGVVDGIDGVDGLGRLVLGGLAAVLLGGLFVHEMIVGYRSSSLFEDANAD